MWLRVVLLLACTLPAWLRAETGIGVVSIVDGEVFVTRESTRFVVAEGLRVQADDIVESGAQTRLVRIELHDGVVFDLGPATRVLMTPRFPGERSSTRTARLYVLRGWAKITAAPTKAGDSARVASESFDLSSIGRDVVLNVEPGGAAAFAESGEVTFTERAKGKPAAPLKMKVGEFVSRSAQTKAVLAARPAPDFIQRVPRAFLDTLPRGAALFFAC
jgi:hypothetical protein